MPNEAEKGISTLIEETTPPEYPEGTTGDDEHNPDAPTEPPDESACANAGDGEEDVKAEASSIGVEVADTNSDESCRSGNPIH